MGQPLNIKKPHQLAAYSYLRAAIYGGPGVGKSSLAVSGRKVLYIAADDGVHRINERHHVDTIEVRQWEDISAILDGDIAEYDTLAIDTMGKMLLYMNDYLIRMNTRNAQGDGSLTQKAYGVRKAMFMDFINRISPLKKHLFFVCHDKEDKKGEGGALYVRPDVGGSSGNDLIRELDIVAYVFIADGGKRMMTCDPGANYYGKNTLGLQTFMELPNIMNGPNDFMARLTNTFEQQAEARAAVKVKYRNIIDDITARSAACKTPEAITALYGEVDGLEQVWDSRVAAKKAVADRAKEMGLIADPASKSFKKPAKKSEDKPAVVEAAPVTGSTPGSEGTTEVVPNI